MLFAVIAASSIARGRVTSLDVAAAKRHPGVVEVMTSANRPKLAIDPEIKTNPFVFRMESLQNDEVRYANQPIAVVIAQSLEAATEGAALLAPRYEVLPPRVGLDAGEVFVPPVVGVGNPTVNEHGRRFLRDVAAPDRREEPYRPDGLDPRRRHQARGLILAITAASHSLRLSNDAAAEACSSRSCKSGDVTVPYP